MKTSPKHIYRKYCHDCEKLYSPTGRYQKYCEKCIKESKLKKKYNKNDN